MKKIVIIIAMAIATVSCNKTVETKEFKTAYVDIIKLMDESVEAKDIEEKYKAKADEMDGSLSAEIKKFESEAANFKTNAAQKGQVWAQQKGAELQQREQQLQYAKQAMAQQLQGESGSEMDSLFIKYKKIFKDFGKDKGYDYIFGNSQAESVLFAKDSYDITKEVIKLVNDKYKSEGKKEDKPSEKKASK